MGNCDEPAQEVLPLLSRLSPDTVAKISRTHPDRQRFALAQMRQGRPPLGKPPPDVEPPYDTLDYAEVRSRLARTAGLLNCVGDGLLAARGGWPDRRRLDEILHEVDAVMKCCRTLTKLLREAGGKDDNGRRMPAWRPRLNTRPFDPSTAGWKVATVAGIARKNVRDLPRLLRESPPSRKEADELLWRTRWLRRAADRLKAIVRERVGRRAGMPTTVPGVYAVFYRLESYLKQVRIGDLGTFDFPPGIYAYVGSACGHGGVRERTNRHLTAESERRRWNVDYLKPFCTPVAVWWTCDGFPVEFPWAAIVAKLPGAACTAKGFGGADNPKCEAHLFRFDRLPRATLFRSRLKQSLVGHLPVYEKRVEGWVGVGWPGPKTAVGSARVKEDQRPR